MPPADPIPADRLTVRCDPERFSFATTAELDGELAPVGQPRAEAALRFGMGIDDDGFNLFAFGPTGTGKRTFVEHVLRRRAAERPVPRDLCYVNNFGEPSTPIALELARGTGRQLRDDMAELVEEVGAALPAAFEAEAFQARKHAIDDEFKKRSQERLEEIQNRAQERGIAMLQTPMGFVFAPMKDGEVLGQQAFEELEDEERERLQADIHQLQQEVQKVLREAPRWERERQTKQRELSRETAQRAIGHLIDELRERYQDVPAVLRYLDAVEADLIDNAPALLKTQEEGSEQSLAAPMPRQLDDSPLLRRYQVNLMVDHAEDEAAPVVFEDHPTYNNLVGRIEHMSRMGALVTDFTLIRAGALHRANGGFLVLEALKLLQQPFAWDALKRALRAQQLTTESVNQSYGLLSTVSLEPEPVDLAVKVVLLGEPLLYYLLSSYDPEFPELFKVAVDFDDRLDRSEDHQDAYARLIAAIATRHELRPLDAGAVARVVDRAARLAGDAEKLTARTAELADLLREANYWAGQAGRDVVAGEDVQTAIDAQTYRVDRIRERLQEATLRDLLHIATDGEEVGQVNGLAVLELGGFSFGRPHRISASVRVGKGEVVDIEREVELGGPVHAKGVMILAGFLGGRFGARQPLSLSASLVFEQTYSTVEGDSASLAELVALLAAIAEVPVRQHLAVTGSVSQRGAVQTIGGVNEKIEGFFDLCRARGLSGRQGVLVPASNAATLMLRDDVVEAARRGEFHVTPVATVDEAAELLTGLPMGAPDDEGVYPEDSLGGRVQRRLEAFAERLRQQEGDGGEEAT
jgi:lon-related putative ATP-dependent protease